MKCALCRATVLDVEDAIESGWSPSYWEGEDECEGPVCVDCAGSKCRFNDDGELILLTEAESDGILADAIATKVDVTRLCQDDRDELLIGAKFYVRGGHTFEQAAALAIEEVLTPEQARMIPRDPIVEFAFL